VRPGWFWNLHGFTLIDWQSPSKQMKIGDMAGPPIPDDKPQAPAVNGKSKPADSETTLEPVTQQFIDALASTPPLQTFLATEARAILARAQLGPVGKPRASIEDLTFPVGPTGTVQVRITRPPRPGQTLPVVMFLHGGSSVVGDEQMYDRLMREIAVGVGAAVIYVDYDRAFQSPFPNAIEQAYAVTKYVVDEASRLNVDASRLAVVGDGVGGNIAAVLTLMAKERRGPKIDLQILLYPVTDVDFETPSYRRFADGPWLTRSAMQWFWDAYMPDHGKRGNCKCTPLNATIDQLRNLPDAMVIVAENDVLRDEGEAYARKLSDAGIRVTSIRYNGTIHDFVLLDALADTPAVRSAVAQIITALKGAFD
jgi:acetyl esterase